MNQRLAAAITFLRQFYLGDGAEGESVALVCDEIERLAEQAESPIPIRLNCPECSELHVDEGEWASRLHHTHSCQKCGHTWRPAVAYTVGVRFLPGFKNEVPKNEGAIGETLLEMLTRAAKILSSHAAGENVDALIDHWAHQWEEMREGGDVR